MTSPLVWVNFKVILPVPIRFVTWNKRCLSHLTIIITLILCNDCWGFARYRTHNFIFFSLKNPIVDQWWTAESSAWQKLVYDWRIYLLQNWWQSAPNSESWWKRHRVTYSFRSKPEYYRVSVFYLEDPQCINVFEHWRIHLRLSAIVNKK